MKIIKAHKNKNSHLYLMVDNIPQMTYEKIGSSYVGADKENYFSDYLKYERGSGNFMAFGGREIRMQMKDGSIQKLKDHWWDSGHYDREHKYINIGLGMLDELQNCFVFRGYNIRKDKLELLVEEYLKNDIFYEYYDIEKWAKLQCDWFPLIFHGRQLPFLMNCKGDIIDVITKERKYALHNYIKVKKTKYFKLKLFKLEYRDNNRLIKLEDSYDNIVKETLPSKEFSEYKLLKR